MGETLRPLSRKRHVTRRATATTAARKIEAALSRSDITADEALLEIRRAVDDYNKNQRERH